MFKSPHTIRLVKAFVLAAALSALVVPAAQAGDKSDAVDRGVAAQAGVGNDSKQYGIPRAMPSHYAAQQVGLPRTMPSDYAKSHNSTQTQPVDFRSADTRDAVYGRYPEGLPTLVAVPGGFDWGDATFGAGMTAAALLVAGAIAIGIRHHKRVALS